MRINKAEALTLSKALHVVRSGGLAVYLPGYQIQLESVSQRLDAFLSAETSLDSEGSTTYPVEEEVDEEEEEELDEEDAEDAEDDEADDEEAEDTIEGETLQELKPVKGWAGSGSSGKLRFEMNDYGFVVAFINDERYVDDVDQVMRHANRVVLYSNEGSMHTFNVDRFPKGWADALPLEVLLEVN